MKYGISSSVLLLMIAVAGCTKHHADANAASASPIQQEATPYTLALVFDFSPGYHEILRERAYKYALGIKDGFFRDRAEPHDRLVLAQVSGDRKEAVMWDARPRTFKREFPNADKFWDYLSHQPRSSLGLHTHENVAQTLDYVLSCRGPNQAGKSAVLVFSELEDTSPDPVASRKRLITSLQNYAKAGGHIGFYWMSMDGIARIQAIFKDAGLEGRCLTVGKPREDPVFPTFDDN